MVSPSVSEDGLSKWDFWELDPSAPTSPEWTAQPPGYDNPAAPEETWEPKPDTELPPDLASGVQMPTRPPSSEPTPLKS